MRLTRGSGNASDPTRAERTTDSPSKELTRSLSAVSIEHNPFAPIPPCYVTVTEVKNQVLSHFITKTVFTVDDMTGIKVDANAADWGSEIVRAALTDLEAAGLLRKVSSTSRDAWILVRPFSSYSQQVNLSTSAIEAMGNCINGFIGANELDWQMCDKSALEEGDVMTLVDIIHTLLDVQTDPDLSHDRN